MKVALLAGTSIENSGLFGDWGARTVATEYGVVECRFHGDLVLLNRHGSGPPLPPHAINHRANLRALVQLGYVDVLALSSVGSLQPDLPPGTLVSCRDYVSLQEGPATFFDDRLQGGTPEIANNLMPRLIEALAPRFEVRPGKVYVQMRGPRFETRAEVAVIRRWGDVVGMTLGREADLCIEAGLRYNSLAMVDNFANGIGGEVIDFERFRELVHRNQATVDALLARLLEILS